LDPRQYEVLADSKALYMELLAISVVVPPAFARNADAVAGVCDSAPKPARSQGRVRDTMRLFFLGLLIYVVILFVFLVVVGSFVCTL
jgi:hypothetical protein